MFKPSLAAAVAVAVCLCATAIHAKETAAAFAPLPRAVVAAAPSPPPPPTRVEPAAQVLPAPASGPSEVRWEVRTSDVTLAKTLERWALAAGHKLKWDASRNFLIGAPDVYVGSFEGALQHILSSPGIRYSDFPLEACIYANTPPLVRITRQGEQSRECDATAPRP